MEEELREREWLKGNVDGSAGNYNISSLLFLFDYLLFPYSFNCFFNFYLFQFICFFYEVLFYFFIFINLFHFFFFSDGSFELV